MEAPKLLSSITEAPKLPDGSKSRFRLFVYERPDESKLQPNSPKWYPFSTI